MSTINPEIRAAEIVAGIQDNYSDGDWFDVLSAGERRGWDKHEGEWWDGTISAPRNRPELAGWLAREIWIGDNGKPDDNTRHDTTPRAAGTLTPEERERMIEAITDTVDDYDLGTLQNIVADVMRDECAASCAGMLRSPAHHSFSLISHPACSPGVIAANHPPVM